MTLYHQGMIKKLLPLFLFASCSSYVHTPQTRMISPETQGAFGSGHVEARLAAVKQDRLGFPGNDINQPVDSDVTVHKLGGMVDFGLLKRLDVIYSDSIFGSAVGILGLKVQFLGKTRNESKKGNFSASVFAGYGNTDEDVDDETDLENWVSNIDKIDYKVSHDEYGLILGYRWEDRLLHYFNAYYFHQNLKGSVTTDDNVLLDQSFEDTQNGMLYSTGLIFDLGTAWYIKADYSHMVSKWSSYRGSSANSVNAAIGAYW